MVPLFRTLDSFEGDASAEIADFFGTWAGELVDEADARMAGDVGAAFVRVHRVTRLGAMFKLPRAKALQTVTDAGGDEPFLESIELHTGMHFREQTVPHSALLAESGQRSSGEGPTQLAKDSLPRKTPTISEELVEEGTLHDEVVPFAAWQVIKTPDPHLRAITHPEAEAFFKEILAYYVGRFLRFNMGRDLCKHLGYEIRNKLKLPDYGQGENKRLGDDRDPGQILYELSKNRKKVHVSPASRPRTRCRAYHLHPHWLKGRRPLWLLAESLQEAARHLCFHCQGRASA